MLWSATLALLLIVSLFPIFRMLSPSPTVPVEPSSPVEPIGRPELSYLSFAPPGENFRCLEEPGITLPGQGTLTTGKTFIVPKMGKVVVYHSAGHQLDFSDQAQFRLDSEQILLNTGKVVCAIKAGSGPFSVKTMHGSVHTLGTRFSVETGPDETRVTLFEGKILLKTILQEITLGNHETMILSGSGKIRRPDTANNGVNPVTGVQPDVSTPEPTGTGNSAEGLNTSF